MGTEMIENHSKIDDYIKKFERQQKNRGLFKSLALLANKPSIKIAKRSIPTKSEESKIYKNLKLLKIKI
jgi:hypothetical protein